MFESRTFENNDKIIEECITLVDKYNDKANAKMKILAPVIRYKHIGKNKKSYNRLSKDIVSLYEVYVRQVSITEDIATILKHIDDNSNELSFQIDRSPDAIASILSDIAYIRADLMSNRIKIINGVNAETSAFVDRVTDYITNTNDIDFVDVIDVLFACMKQCYSFIAVGLRMVKCFSENGVLCDDHMIMIKNANNEIKRVLLNADENSEIGSINQLQTFGLVPDEGCSKTLQEVLHNLLGLDGNYHGQFASMKAQLIKSMKLITADTGLRTGLIIQVSNNSDIYFNMQSLSTRMPTGLTGVSTAMIDAYDIIREPAADTTVKNSSLITINVSETTQLAYVLWTNDMKTFKSRARPIDESIIKKLIRGTPSTIIDAYNSMMDKVFTDSRSSDIISFNQIKYLSFSNEMTEDKFLTLVHARLLKYMTKYIIGRDNAKKMIVDAPFDEKVLDIIDESKSDLGLAHQSMPPHCHVIYASAANLLLSRLKKNLLSLDSIDDKSADTAISDVVRSNDNIYSRTIVAYYLHAA
jgi:hypothetical protein